MTARYAQIGDADTCVRCRYSLTFELMAYDALSDEPIYRWRAARRTKRARNPFICPEHNTGGYHLTTTHSCTGLPLSGSTR